VVIAVALLGDALLAVALGQASGWVVACGSGASRTPKAVAQPGSNRPQSPIC